MLIPDDNGKIQKQLEKNTRLTFSSMDLKNKKFPKYRPRAACKQTLFFDFFKKLLNSRHKKAPRHPKSLYEPATGFGNQRHAIAFFQVQR